MMVPKSQIPAAMTETVLLPSEQTVGPIMINGAAKVQTKLPTMIQTYAVDYRA